MRACWLKWVGRDWSISADYIWLNYSDANSWSASASIAAFTTCLASLGSSSRMSMAPSLKRGMASMSGAGSDKIYIAIFVLSRNLLLW